MSLIAKIFIVFQALLSVAFLAVTATLYAYRTDWRTQTISVQQQYSGMVKAKNSAIDALKEEKRALRDHIQQQDRENEVLRSSISDLSAQVANARRESTEWEQAFYSQQYLNQILAENENSKVAQITALSEQVNTLNQQHSEAQARRRVAEAQVVELMRLKQEAEAAQLALRNELRDSREKLSDLQLVMGELRRMGIDPEVMIAGPPQPPIRAVVLAISRDTDPPFVLLSQGRDDGVQPGFIFLIYQDDELFGQVIVEDVLPDRCAARVLFEVDGKMIESGCEAATRLGL